MKFEINRPVSYTATAFQSIFLRTTDRRTDGTTDRRTDGQIDGQTSRVTA